MTDASPIRADGRTVDALRPVSIQTDFLDAPAGSALIRAGSTMVLCTATIDESVPKWMAGKGKGWLTAEYSMLPGSTGRRNPREVTKGKIKGRTQEIQRLIGRSLRAACDMRALGERTIYIDCDVLQADGGTRTASITGGYVALARAINGLMTQGLLESSPLVTQIAAVSVGIVDGVAMLDLPYVEDVRADVDMNVVMTRESRFVEVQGTAEGVTFSGDELSQMLALAQTGIQELHTIQRAAISGESR